MMFRRIALCVLSAALCVAACGCHAQTKTDRPDVTAPTKDHAIIPQFHQSTADSVTYTPVYASSFGDTILLATVPMEEWHGEESDCPAREISNGGRIKCNGDHEKEVPTKTVLILEDLIPRVCSGWFRDMLYLEKVEGIDKIHTHQVTDMSYMFAGCERLTQLDVSSWEVDKVQDMTDMFKDCYAMEQLPEWYQP